MAEELGVEADGLSPAGARAIKLNREDQERKNGIVDYIDYEISFRGLFKPTGNLVTPIDFKGAKIKRFNLHNALIVKDHKVGPGATVSLIRSGDVIPYFMGTIKPAEKSDLPTKCKHCKTKLEWTDVDLFCPNFDCIGIKSMVLKNFFQVIKVDGVAGGVIDQLIEAGYDSIPKLLTADEDKLSTLDGWGAKKAAKIAKGLRSSMKGVKLAKLMKASSFFADTTSGIGETILNLIIDHLGEKRILNSNIKEAHITGIDDVGPDRRRLFLNGIEPFRRMYQQIKSVSDIKLAGKVKAKSAKLAHVTACFTGFRDTEAKSIIELNGGIVKESLTKDVNLLFAKDASTDKASRAAANGIKIIPMAMVMEYLRKEMR